ncbi:uncharacterized protein [Equus przewalskii]|uniref:Uncharacterized protein isoform X2 n=1 Tax=Equus przewalskii TaxID=9798 RepID=A0ABM4NVS1_EQUPR
MVTLRCKASLGAPAEDTNAGAGAGKGSASALQAAQGEGSARVHARPPDLPWGSGGSGISSTAHASAHAHTHTHTLTHAWPDPRLAPSHLRPRPARGCGGYSPSARERISDTVLRMVGIAAAAAGGSSAGTLHLSRRRAGGRPGSRERSAASRAGSATHPGQRGGRARPPHAGWSRRRRERRRQRWRSGTSLYKVGFLWLDEHESEAKLKGNLIESWVLH